MKKLVPFAGSVAKRPRGYLGGPTLGPVGASRVEHRDTGDSVAVYSTLQEIDGCESLEKDDCLDLLREWGVE